MDHIIDHNRRAWDSLVRQRQRFTRPIKEKDLADPLATVDSSGWLTDGVHGKCVLCLAAGGGRQSVLYAKAGAHVTVVDISEEMLELDRRAAKELALDIEVIHASMHDLSQLPDSHYDVVIHPVSTCYLPEIKPVYDQVAGVIKTGGVYISQHKTPTSLQARIKPEREGYLITEPYYFYSTPKPMPPAKDTPLRETGTLEYLHRWEQIIGGLCQCGFVIEDLSEPCHAKKDAPHGSFEHRARFIAPYVRIKARRIESPSSEQPKLLTP